MRLWCTMTGIGRKNQGFGRENKTRAIDIVYNPIESFYILDEKKQSGHGTFQKDNGSNSVILIRELREFMV